MKVSEIYPTTAADSGIDWHAIKDKIVLTDVAINLLGPARERKGRRLLWTCPFHDDRHPSFQVDTSRGTWRCWTCGIGGDAAELVMRINKYDFPGAVRFLAELVGIIPGGATSPPP